jgi:hypothetical protein
MVNDLEGRIDAVKNKWPELLARYKAITEQYPIGSPPRRRSFFYDTLMHSIRCYANFTGNRQVLEQLLPGAEEHLTAALAYVRLMEQYPQYARAEMTDPHGALPELYASISQPTNYGRVLEYIRLSRQTLANETRLTG